MNHLRLFMVLGALVITGCINQFYQPTYTLERHRVDRSNHTAIFPIASGAHSGMDCNACHGQFSTFTQFSCVTCHDHAQASTDSLHVGLAGYRYGDTTCYACHPTGEGMTREAHDSLFPIVGGAHGSIGCGECHPTGTVTFSCITCHNHAQAATDSLHVGAVGYTYGATTCFTCHPKGEGMSRQAHASLFPIDSGAHGSIACSECHPSGTATFSCITCHNHAQAATDSLHVGAAGYSYGATTCFTCHPKGEGMSRDAHASLFPIVGGAHGSITCSECHPSGLATFDCIACHNHACSIMNSKHTDVSNYSCTSSSCFNCHPQGRAEGGN